MKQPFLIVAFLGLNFIVFAQNNQDCFSAIPVCQEIYVEENAPFGFGNQQDFTNTCVLEESNSLWYIFTVNNSGQFGFMLTPNNPNDDYDWVLFNITNASCNDIFNNPNLLVSCNSAGNDGCFGPTGATGETEFNNQGMNCNNTPPSQSSGFSPFNDLIDVQEGNTYVLCVNNFLGSTGGYTIDFGFSSDIGIFDETPPLISNLELSGDCSGENIELTFSEFVQCNTVDASIFSFDGPGGPFNVTIADGNCMEYNKAFNLSIAPPLQLGEDYIFNMSVNGIDQVLDLCDLPAVSESFELSQGAPLAKPVLGADTTLCPSASLLLDLGSPGGEVLWSDGSTETTLNIITAGVYAVTISTECSMVSDTIVVDFVQEPAFIDLGPDTTICGTDPIILDVSSIEGNYLWQDGSTGGMISVSSTGTYFVQVETTCAVLADTIEVIFINDELIVDIGNDTTICPGNILVLSPNIPQADYLWQDNSTNPTFAVSGQGDYSVTVTSECGQGTADISVEYATPINFTFEDTTICSDQALLLDFSLEGAQYNWQDGSTNSTYEVTAPGTYAVEITTDCETKELSAQVNIENGSLPNIDLGEDTTICDGGMLALEFNMPDYQFLWQDGSTSSSYQISSSGLYSVEVSNNCGSISDAVQVTILNPILADLGRDTILCEGQSFVLDIMDENATSYLWQDGSVESRFIVDKPGLYQAEISNECETVVSEVLVSDCQVCFVEFPNIFSPNGDGINDLFVPLSDCNFVEFEFLIFDRWGNLVFKTTDISNGWDGKYFLSQELANVGTYAYLLKYTIDENGKTTENQVTGDITLAY